MQRVTLPNITDLNGTSNTFLAVEAGEAVPWTMPDELPFDPKKPPKLGGHFPGGFLALMCDGTVRFVSKDIPPETIAKAVNYRNTIPFSLDKP